MRAMSLLFTLFAQAPGAIVVDRPVPKQVTGVAFRKLLREKIKLFQTEQAPPLRKVLNRLRKDLSLAIVLDRRIDPTRAVKIDVANKSVLEILQAIAGAGSAEAVVVDDFVYVAPPGTAKRLRAVVAARSSELRKLSRNLRRRFVEKRILHWNDLDEPRKIVQAIAGKYKLRVESAEKIPHDLWAGATVPRSNLIDQLSLILIQYDLTFSWSVDGQSVTIQPLESQRR